MNKVTVFVSAIFVATLSLNAVALPDDGNKKPRPLTQILELEVKAPGSNLTDKIISTLLATLNPPELANAQYALENYGVSIANCANARCPQKIANALAEAKQIYSAHAEFYLNDVRDPSYIMPIVAIDGRKYLFANKDSFGRGDFDVIISKALFDHLVGFEVTSLNNPYAIIPATAISTVFMILHDICLTGVSLRSHAVAPADARKKFTPKNMTVDLSIFDKRKECPQ